MDTDKHGYWRGELCEPQTLTTKKNAIPIYTVSNSRQAAGCFLTGILIGSLQTFALNGRMWLPDIQTSGKRNCP